MDADAKRPVRGRGRLNAEKGEGVKNWQNLADVVYGWPLTENIFINLDI